MNDYDVAAERVDRKIKFKNDFIAYMIVNVVLGIINYLVSPHFGWVFFVTFFWGIGILKDFFKAYVFVDYFGSGYRERKIAEEMEKMKL